MFSAAKIFVTSVLAFDVSVIFFGRWLNARHDGVKIGVQKQLEV